MKGERLDTILWWIITIVAFLAIVAGNVLLIAMAI